MHSVLSVRFTGITFTVLGRILLHTNSRDKKSDERLFFQTGFAFPSFGGLQRYNINFSSSLVARLLGVAHGERLLPLLAQLLPGLGKLAHRERRHGQALRI